MTQLTPKDFIKTVFVNEIGSLISGHPYISFMVMGIGIEFLGKCIDSQLLTWNVPNRSQKDFEAAIKKIPSLKKYECFLTSYKLYSSFRCGLAHAASPKFQITLSSKAETGHLIESNNRLNLKVEDFYEDFKDACEYVINYAFPLTDKMNNPFLEVPGTGFNSGTTIPTGYTSSMA